MAFYDKVREEEQKQVPDKAESFSDKRIIEDVTSIDRQDKEIRDRLTKIAAGTPVRTVVDGLYEILLQGPKDFMQLATAMKIDIAVVERFIRVLARSGIVSVTYPIVFFVQPIAKLIEKPPVVETIRSENHKLLEQYTIVSDYVVADIQIWSAPLESTPVYEIVPHNLGFATQQMLLSLREELAERVPIITSEASDPQKIFREKKIFFDHAKQLVQQYFSESEEIIDLLAGSLLHQSFGLGDLEVIMADNWLEEIAINSDTEPMSIYHKRYGWLKTTKYFTKESEIYDIASQIARRVGRQISSLNPIMDAHLQTGDRVAATLFPISTEGDTLTIRRFSRNPWTIVHMIDDKNHTMSAEMMATLWQAVQYEMNILVVGGTASGKTSVLNTLASLIPTTNRIISIEDTREISLPSALHWNWVPMNSRSANAEGQGEVTMLDLMVASLRMRPDRIIVGEIRRQKQAEAMFEAMHTGHSVLATMHADTAEQAKHRLIEPPIQIPENEVQALQLVLVQYRDRRLGVRRTLELAEILPGGSKEKIQLNYLYRWRARKDEFVKDEESIRLVEDLNLHTGMTQKEILKDQMEKKDILQWMLRNRIFDIDKIGHIMRIYYKFPTLLLDTVRDNKTSEDFFNQHGR